MPVRKKSENLLKAPRNISKIEYNLNNVRAYSMGIIELFSDS